MATMPERFASLGDVQAGIDDSLCDLRRLQEWVQRDEGKGLGEAPYPPNFPKMPGGRPASSRPVPAPRNRTYNPIVEEQTHVRLTLEPLDDHLIVEPVDEDVETRTGLIIPQSAEAEARSGVVTAVGLEAHGIEPGDKVLFPKDAGFDVRLGGVAVKVLRRAQLIARVHD